jgi:hypothetical protein
LHSRLIKAWIFLFGDELAQMNGQNIFWVLWDTMEHTKTYIEIYLVVLSQDFGEGEETYTVWPNVVSIYERPHLE